MNRYSRVAVENRIELARMAVKAESAGYRSGSIVNGVSHLAVFKFPGRQVIVRAGTRSELMAKLDAFIEGAYTVING